MITHVATRKDHRCDTCSRRIPIGARYFTEEETGMFLREHTNCLEYEGEAVLPADYNINRSKYQKEVR